MAVLSVLRFVSPPLDTNAYLVADEEGGRVIAIDPACIGADLLWECKSRGWQLDAIVLTHGHIDHIRDAALMARESGAPILTHLVTTAFLEDPVRSGAAWLGMQHQPCMANRLLGDGDTIEVGTGQLRVLHTPGHTPGCICLLGEKECFTGDVLFCDAVGRWDFPGGDEAQLAESIRRLAGACGDEIILYPGHGATTTMGRERRHNPYLLQWL
jgi:glyoxylase-like metal-dependent hydrolase (beta-lactamase superfamily II)